jgi:acyl-CoA synthetase (NDP forming)
MRIHELLARAIQEEIHLLPEDEGKSLLARYRINVPRGGRVSTASELEAAGAEWSYPLVLKVLAPELIHKSDRGAVRVGLRDILALRSAANELWSLFPGSPLLVEEMAPPGVELIAGLVQDEHFGTFLMIGIGGIHTEIYQDVAYVMLPAVRNDVLHALAALKGFKLLTGFRGGPSYEIDPILDTLMALCQFGQETEGYYQSVDVNPLIVNRQGVTALDVKVLLKPQFSAPLQEPEMPPPGSLAAFFEPRSVVIVGASFTPGKPGHEVIRNIAANGYRGRVFLVNPKGGELLGMKVYPTIATLPDGIDQAVIIVPARESPQALRECAEKGIRHVVLSAGGFAEVDRFGAQVQQELETILSEKKVRAIGPNTSGHTSTPHQFTSTFFPLGRIRPGKVSYVAQTGNFATHTMKYILTGEHFGVARVIGLGNKIDLEESEALQYLSDDPETRAILLYLESIKYPRRFLEVAREAARKKPVVILKGGSTEAGKHAAQAHTAAMASEDRLVDALLRQAGIVRIREYSHLILAGKALSMAPLPKGNRVGFLAPSGAMLVVLSDLCTRLGLEIPELEKENLKRLQEISPPFIRMRNPVDIWAAASVMGVEEGYREGMEAVLRDRNIDAVVPILLVTRENNVSLEFIVDLVKKYPEKTILVTFTGDKHAMDECRDYLEPRGVATFPEIEQPFEVLSILARCQERISPRSA